MQSLLPITLAIHYTFDVIESTIGLLPNLYSREEFEFNNIRYHIYSEKVSWDEAGAICEASSRHLAILDTKDKVQIAAERLAESWTEYDDVWVGAKRRRGGTWYWTYNKQSLPENVTTGPYFRYPPWLTNHAPSKKGRNCLALDRNGLIEPIFIDLKCSFARAFICEDDRNVEASDPRIGALVKVKGIDFVLYRGNLSWNEAVSFCRQQGFALATLPNVVAVRKIARTMLKARPAFDSVWIGAAFREGRWIWVESGRAVMNIPGNLIRSEGNITFPWIDGVGKRRCVAVNKHVCNESNFMRMECGRRQGFVCKRASPVSELPVNTAVRDNLLYTFHPIKATWHQANQLCLSISNNSQMLLLRNVEEAIFIARIMSEISLDRAWIGGVVKDGRWKWHPKGGPEGEIRAFPDETGFPPWCDNLVDEKLACLNLDGKNRAIGRMYGLECNATQGVICTQPK